MTVPLPVQITDLQLLTANRGSQRSVTFCFGQTFR
jgi:hypothetical protein